MSRDIFDLPEYTEGDIIDKIEAIAADIRADWNSPKHRANTISRLCGKLRALKEVY